MNANTNELRARFLRALSEASAQRSGGPLFEELLARYGEAHRRYHTIAHVDACLGFFDWYRGSAEHPERVELALWFHDAVSDPAASDNEQRSALLARARLAELGLPREAIDDIEAHVLATKGHRGSGPDTKLVIDLDLGILAAPAPTFARFEREIRQEYGHVPQQTFAIGRRALLSGFLARRAIYSVPALREELEAPARQNLEQRILELASDVSDVAVSS
ncbi:MAG TPA: hypothetical protein VJV79_27830 [Polyangiaceae bacterium]|nr:hypothetical protein [Polyangiaceae bacterium]